MPRQTPRNFVPLDSNYPRDVAIQKAGPMAELLFVRSLAFCKLTRSAGFVSHWDIDEVGSRIRGVKSLANVLVKVGLWEEVEDGWRIRSWDRWNGLGEAESAGGKQGNHIRWHLQRGVVDPGCDFCAESEGESEGDRGRSVPDGTPRIQTELNTSSSYEEEGAPDPDDKPEPPKSKGTRRKSSRALPDDFVVTAEMVAWCRAKGVADDDARFQTERFRNDALAKDRRYADWKKAWENWILQSIKWGQVGTGLRVAASNGKRKWTSEELHAELGPDTKRKPKPPDGLDEEGRWNWERNYAITRHNERVAEAEARIAERMAR